MLGGALIGAALGATPCKPLDSGDFRDYVVDAVTSLERDDLDVTRGILEVLEARMPCLDHAPERRLLADLRVVQAVVAYVDEEDWEGPLAAALRIRPPVDRIVGRAHPIYAWEPPVAPEEVPVDVRHTLYIDGIPADSYPAGPGWYVLQKTDGIDWNTTLLRGALPSATWLAAPLELPRRLHVDGQLFTAAGGLIHAQEAWVVDADGLPEEPLLWDTPSRAYLKGLYGLQGVGQVWIGRLGFRFDGAFHFGAGTSVRTGAMLGTWRDRRLRLGLGVAGADVPAYRRRLDGSEELDALAGARPYAAALVGLAGGSRNQSEADVLLFWRAGAEGRLQSRWVYTFEPDSAGISWTVGVFTNVWTAGFEARQNARYNVRTFTTETGMTLGGRFRGRL